MKTAKEYAFEAKRNCIREVDCGCKGTCKSVAESIQRAMDDAVGSYIAKRGPIPQLPAGYGLLPR